MLLPVDLVVWNNKVTIEDKDQVGLEIASLGEISANKIPIVPIIIVTPHAFKFFQKENNLSVQIKHLLGSLNHARHDSLLQISSFISGHIEHGVMPEEIVKPLFKSIESCKTQSFTIEAFYFQGSNLISRKKWKDISGEAVIIENIRLAWSSLFSPENLKKYSIHHNNHESFSVTISIMPQLNFALTGVVKTIGNSKSDYEIEAHSMVKFVYNKHTKLLKDGHILPGGDKSALSASDLKTLLSYAHLIEKSLYLPQVMYWGKKDNIFLANKIVSAGEAIEYHDTYSLLRDTITVSPGITVGRLKVIDEASREMIVENDEIVMLKRVDNAMLSAVKKAKGIIIEENPHPEVTFILKNFGIPTVIRSRKHFLYSTGDIISLNATTGEIKRGSMLVS